MAAEARIYCPPKTAMQSGWAGTHEWVLVFEPQKAQRPDPLMGWIGGGDTRDQVRLHFDTREEAEAYAQRQGIAYEVEIPPVREFHPKSYAENFRFGRVENWTH
ncbi:MAG: ETC complex I subunit [Rhodospirillales bacterium]|nr:ETC complex I subunit [Rhodospirillales bacterium]